MHSEQACAILATYSLSHYRNMHVKIDGFMRIVKRERFDPRSIINSTL